MHPSLIRVLMVEDNPSDYLLVEGVLQADAASAFDLTHCDRLGSALDLLEQEPFDIVLLDLDLPDSSGLQTFERLRRRAAHLPVVICSGNTAEEIAIQAVHNGAQDYLVKSLSGFDTAARTLRHALERHAGQRHLRASEKRLRALIEHNQDAVAMIDETGAILYESPAIERILGYAPEELSGKLRLSLVHPDDRERAAQILASVLDQPRQPISAVIRFRHKNGALRWVETIYSNWLDDPDLRAIVINSRDITSHKESEDALRQSEDQYRLLFETMAQGVMYQDRKGRMLAANPAAQRILGLTLEEMQASVPFNPHWTTIHEDGSPYPIQDFPGRQALDSGQPVWDEVIGVFTPLESGCRWIKASAIPLFQSGASQPDRVYTTFEDISARKQADEALGEKLKIQEQLEKTAATIPGMIHTFKMDPAGRFSMPYASPAVHDLYGLEAQEVAEDAGRIFARIDPQDLPHVQATIAESARTLAPWRDEFRLHHPQKGLRWLEGHSSPVQADDGSLLWHGYIQDVTERHTSQDAIQRNERRFRTIFENSPLTIGIVDLDSGTFVDVNPAMLNLTGFTREELIGHSPSEMKIWGNEAERDLFLAALRAGESLKGAETTLSLKSGEPRRVLLYVEPVDLNGGHSLLFQVIDITAQKQTESALADSEERLKGLIDSALDAIVSADDHLKIVVFNKAAERMFMLPAAVALGQQLGCLMPQRFHGMHIEHAFRIAEESGRMQNSGQVLPVMGLRANGEEFPAETSYSFIETKKGKLFTAILRDVTERKRFETTLQESEERFRSMFEYSKAVMLVLDPDTGQIVDANPAAAQYYGYSRERLAEMKIGDINQTGAEEVAAQLERARLEQRNHFIFPHRLADGQVRSVEVYSHPVVTRGKALLYSIIFDITERRLAESRLTASEERLRRTLEATSDGFWIVGPDQRFVEVNSAYCAMTGYNREELLAMRITDLEAAESEEETFARIARIQHCGQDRFETRHHRKDGSLFSVEVSVNVIDAQAGLMVCFCRDISARKQAEARLIQSQWDLAEAQHIARLGNWHLDLTTSRVTWSDELYRIFEVAPAEFGHDYAAYLARIHPADREQMATINQQARAKGESFEIEYRILTGGGRIKFIREIGYAMRNGAGQVSGMFGIAQDITERKQAEILVTAQRDLARAIGRTTSAGEGFRLCLQAVLDLTGLDSGGIYLFDDNDQGLELIYHQGLGEEFVRAVSHFPAQSPNVALMRQGQPIYTDHEATQHNEMYTREGLRAICVVPIYYQDSVLGCLNLASHTLDLVPEEVRYPLETLAVEIGNYAIYLRSLEALRASEEKYRGLAEASDALTVLLDKEGRVLYANEQAARSQGISAVHSLGKNLKDLMPAAVAARYLGWTRQVIDSDQGIVVETSLGQRHFRTSVQPIHDPKGKAVLAMVVATDISELKAAQKELEQLNHSLEERVRQRTAEVQDLYDSAPTGYHSLDLDGKVVMINQTELNWLGYTRGEMVGQPFQDFITSPSFEVFKANFPVFKQRGWLRDVELELVRKDGSTFSVLVNATAIYDSEGHYLMSRSTLFDITERKKIEQELRESEEQNRLLFDEGPEPTILFDEGGKMVRLNHAFETLSGLEAGDLIGHRLDEIGLLEREQMAKLASLALENIRDAASIATLEFQLRQPSGERRAISARVFTIRPRKRQHYLVSMRDITLTKRAEETLRLANAELERALRMKDEFLANMSHELRTPLNAILGLSESLLEQVAGPLTAKQQKYLNTINESGSHLLELINDILDLAKVESGQVKLELRQVDINEACEASMRMIWQLANKKNQKIVYESALAAGSVLADERRLKQMIVNLLSNAVKFTPANGKIGLSVSARPEEKRLLIEIWDTGIGIRQEDIPRLFRPFVQLDSTLSREATGTGLGLVLVANIARMHGGSVSITSQMGEGSRFTISLPWDPAGDSSNLPSIETVPAVPGAMLFPGGFSPTILLVEDTETSVVVIRDFLESAGFRVVVATNGVEAIALASSLIPDLILMDVQMPGLDGLTATRRIRQDPRMQTLPILALTALAMDSDRERCFDAGMDDYISKPVNLKELAKTIASHLERTRKDRKP